MWMVDEPRVGRFDQTRDELYLPERLGEKDCEMLVLSELVPLWLVLVVVMSGDR